MPTTYSTSLRLSLIATGEQAGTWGTTTNTNLGTLLEQAIAGYVSITMLDANYTLTASNGLSDESRNATIKAISSSTHTAIRTIIIPNVEKAYFFWNATTGVQSVRIGTAASPSVYVDIANGYACSVFCDGASNVYRETAFINPLTGAVSVDALIASSSITGTSLIPSGATIPTNGVYLPAANTVGFSTDSTARFYIGSLGQLGIGGTVYGSAGQVLFSGGASSPPNWAIAGTVTSVAVSGGTTGLSTSGGPITGSGTITLAGTLDVDNGGTGVSTIPSNGQILLGNGSGYTVANLTGGSGVTITNSSGAVSISATGLGGTVTSVGQSFTGGLISVSGSPVTGSGTLALTVAGTSGGIPYFNTSTSWSTSALLAANSIVVGGGAGVAPYTTTTGSGVVTAIGNAINTNGGILTMPSAPSVGQLLIGNGTNYTNATLTAGSGISINNSAGTVEIISLAGGGSVTSVGQTFTGGLISVSGSPIVSSGTLALTVAGTSGGVPYFSSTSTWATSAVLVLNAIVIGGGTGAPPATTTTGSGVLGAIASAVDTNGGLLTVDGTATLLSKTINGSSNTITNVSLTTGVTGTLPTTKGGTNLTTFTGANRALYSTSSSELTTGTLPIAVGGTGVTTSPSNGALLIGNGSGYTVANITAGTGITVTNSSGGIAIAAISGGAGTVTSVGQTFTGGLITVSGTPIIAAGTLALTVSGTSGGIVYFSSSSTWATSAALTSNALVVGGGTGAAPATITTGSGVVTAIANGVNTTNGLLTMPGTATNGSLLIGNGTNYSSANISPGTNTTVTNGAGSIAINVTGVAISGAVTGTGITMSTNRILGRTTASTGAIEEITIGSGLTLSAGSLSTSGAAINVQTFTSSGTWTKPSGYAAGSRVFIEAWGGGGSGSKSPLQACGGGGGGYNERWLTLSSMGATETVTIGAGGVARTSNQDGSNGGQSTIGAHITGYGGGGGNTSEILGGGGGGGQLSTPVDSNPGLPFALSMVTGDLTTVIYTRPQGIGAAFISGESFPAPAAFWHGGGGAGCRTSGGTVYQKAGNSLYGGGGGGSAVSATGATSQYGGNGGAGASGTATAGSQPGGGGGGSSTGTSGAGGDGKIIVTVFPA